MKNTKEAVRYGIETLGVSPDEMFSLIETSKGYEGDDYKRWLANEIVKIAEKDGVGYSQLLVKKFNIIQDMMNTKELTMKSEWVEYFNTQNSDKLWSVDFPEAGTPLEDVDWFNGIDYDAENSFFLQEELPELYEQVLNEEVVEIVATLSDTTAKKNTELYNAASQLNLNCKNVGSLFLYRLCQIVEAFDLVEDFELKLLMDTDFLLDKENDKVWSYFLNYFKYTGYAIKSSDLYDGALGEKEFALLLCKPRTGEEAVQDCVMLSGATYKDGSFLKTGKRKRYTRSSQPLLDELGSTKGTMVELPKETLNEGLTNEKVVNVKDVLGYLNTNTSYGSWLSSFPAGGKGESIPITRENLNDVILYYSVSTALKTFGINETISLPLTGDNGYKKLLYNCIPLFLFSVNSRFRGYKGEKESSFDLERSDLVESLLKAGEVYYSFEAKELVDLCKGYSEFLVKNCGENISCKCFNDLRLEADYAEFNSLYLSKVRNLCDYVKGLYKEMM